MSFSLCKFYPEECWGRLTFGTFLWSCWQLTTWRRSRSGRSLWIDSMADLKSRTGLVKTPSTLCELSPILLWVTVKEETRKWIESILSSFPLPKTYLGFLCHVHDIDRRVSGYCWLHFLLFLTTPLILFNRSLRLG